ncbi:hypothetical protein [Novosphingobium sp. AAP83]|uniref:hypothetical protein n=1 Tax=Novosphingobium sp. AAP83 TaxID=1523425 RepID=UPI001E4FDF76|nr:hypothetical protein [Novosphingobium sp. AAP83]
MQRRLPKLMKHMRGRGVFGAGLAFFGLAGVAWACADSSCYPSWRLGATSFDCAGQAMINPGNDTRINLLLLMQSMSSNETKTPIAAPERPVMEPQFGQTFMSWQGLREAMWPKPPEEGTTTDYSEPACLPPSDFAASLNAESTIPAGERETLMALRAKVGCEQVTWDGAITSAKGREYLAYLKAANAFYAGDWTTARSGFAALQTAKSPWVAETASYMPIRIGLRAAVANATGEYGDFEAAKVDRPAIAEAKSGIAAYLKAWPNGRYAASATGLTRRVLWLEGNGIELARIYERMVMTTPAHDEAAADLAEEIDIRVFGANAYDSPKALPALARTGDTPMLLAIADLMQMRSDSEAANTLSASDLAAQAAQFGKHPELFGFLQASRAWYAGEDASAIMTLIPDDARQAAYKPLAFSRQTLRGMALARKRDPNEAGFWQDLLKGASPLHQRPLVELGLARRWQSDGRLDRIFAADSPIKDMATREVLLQTVASPAILRTAASDATRPGHERDVARFMLLYKGLSRGAYRDFARDVALVPANANSESGLYSLIQQSAVPVGLFTKGRWSDGFACPSITVTATTLASAPADRKALLCLGDFWRLNGFDGFSPYSSDAYGEGPRTDTLGSGPDAFPGKPLYRDAIYKAVIADRQASADLRAYALYRAVRCYAPSGYNGCAGPFSSNAEMDKAQATPAQRKAWFTELKTAYPASRWAKALRFYW